MTNQYTVTEIEQNKRIDKLLTDLIKDVSRSQAQSWLADGYAHVNGRPAKANYKCQTGDTIAWVIPEADSVAIEPEPLPLSVVYEDADLLVVNKPKGMVVHPSPGHERGTLVNALLHHCDQLSTVSGDKRPGIVHRIDKDTSGLLVVAKNDKTHEHLAKQLASNEIDRQYEAIVHDVIPHDTGWIDAPIGRNPYDRKRMDVVETGKEAATHFRVVQRLADFTHVRCQLKTGRTHQIRVHLKYIGFPVAGDPKYGPRKTWAINGQALHAGLLRFRHPQTEELLSFDVEAPAYFQKLLAQLDKTY